MLFGIVIGTYSSIYIAAPVILLWGVKRSDEDAEPLKPANVPALSRWPVTRPLSTPTARAGFGWTECATRDRC
jgi:hypothetical protein